jgi:hypothetical protein
MRDCRAVKIVVFSSDHTPHSSSLHALLFVFALTVNEHRLIVVFARLGSGADDRLLTD